MLDANVYPASAQWAAPVWNIRASVPHRRIGLIDQRGVTGLPPEAGPTVCPILALLASVVGSFIPSGDLAVAPSGRHLIWAPVSQHTPDDPRGPIGQADAGPIVTPPVYTSSQPGSLRTLSTRRMTVLPDPQLRPLALNPQCSSVTVTAFEDPQQTLFSTGRGLPGYKT
jgi:hypothetical protein